MITFAIRVAYFIACHARDSKKYSRNAEFVCNAPQHAKLIILSSKIPYYSSLKWEIIKLDYLSLTWKIYKFDNKDRKCKQLQSLRSLGIERNKSRFTAYLCKCLVILISNSKDLDEISFRKKVEE